MGIGNLTLPAVGKAKAQRIAQHLATLLPAAHRPDRPLFALVAMPALTLPLSIASGSDSSGPPRLLEVSTDAEAVRAWIAARAGSAATAKAYQREATRLMLWLQHKRQRRLAQMDIEYLHGLPYMTRHAQLRRQAR